MAKDVDSKTKQAAEPVKARPGYRLYAIEAMSKEDIEFAYHEDEVAGTRLLHREDGKMKKCLMVEVPEDMGKELQADFEKDKAANMRENRCQLPSKNGKTKLCHLSAERRMTALRELAAAGRLDEKALAFLKSGQTFTCATCPIPESYKMNPQRPLSISLMQELGQDLQSYGFGTEKYMELMAEFGELVDKLRRNEPLLFHMMTIRYEHPDYQDEDIWLELGIGSSKYYKEKGRLIALRREYIDI